MDRSALTRKRTREAPSKNPAPPTTNVLRGKRTAQNTQPQRHENLKTPPIPSELAIAKTRPQSGKIRSAKDSSEIIRAKRGANEDHGDPNAQHFTVGNVGAGGTLYLKPSRMPHSAHFSGVPIGPATPPGTSDGADSMRTMWPSGRTSDMSAAGWTPRMKSSAYDHSVPVPPVSLANVQHQQKRRPRSHSFSTVSERERMRSPTLDSTDVHDFFQMYGGNRRTSNAQRPKSSMDLGDGLLKLSIPHYRLGTPRFSERGTAYLHTSMHTTTTEDMGSSIFSRAEFDNIFPVPPGGLTTGTPRSYLSRAASSPYLRSSAAYNGTATHTPPTPPASSSGDCSVNPAIYDRIEGNANDPSIVRYSPETGRIVAATPARLIAQITSPRFLDYELLSDFFLTFRGFLSCLELLDYLLARMKWAMGTTFDSGRIVRVRTFVALRHWILNYFSDDFMPEYGLRKRFCDLVNQMCSDLRQRHDKGGGDLNILGELKKCWRRTCASYWPVSDVASASPEAEIEPGEQQTDQAFVASAVSLPLALRHDRLGDSNQAAMAPQVSRSPQSSTTRFVGLEPMNVPESSAALTRKTSIPASPMSEQSMQVLSCSVPFLRTVCQPKSSYRSPAPRPVGSNKNPPVALDQVRPSNQHKRSGSFSDALRDERAPLPSTKVEGGDLQNLPNITFTGGLVRGLLLQPCPAEVDTTIPLSPTVETAPRTPVGLGIDERLLDDQQPQHLGVKRIVGDVRRALSHRKMPSNSPNRSGSISGSQSSDPISHSRHGTSASGSTWQLLRGPPRTDILGANIESAYRDAYQKVIAQNEEAEAGADNAAPSQHDSVEADDGGLLKPKRPDLDRVTSQVTTSSQSIMIVDATGPPELPMPAMSRALPSVSSWSSEMTPAPLFRSPGEEAQQDDYFGAVHHMRPGTSGKTMTLHRENRRSLPLHDLLPSSEDWQYTPNSAQAQLNVPNNEQARRSSEVHTPGSAFPQIHNPLRRRPGGDLKAAGHVHELEPEQRPYSDGSASTVSQSLVSSGVASRELSGTHFSRQDIVSQLAGLRTPNKPDASFGLLDTPSQPYVRKSFESDALRIAKLPEHSPGGVEDALKKLEGGTADRSSVQGIYNRSRDSTVGSADTERPGDRRSRVPTTRKPSFPLSPYTDRQGASIYRVSDSDVGALTDDLRFSISDLTDERSNAPVLASASRQTRFPISNPDSIKSSKSVAFASVPSHVQLATDANLPSASQGSFLLDDNESLSEISTEMDEPAGDDNMGVRSFFFDDTVEEEINMAFQAPPSPPSTASAPLERASSPQHQRLSQRKKVGESAPKLKEAASAPKVLSSEIKKQDIEISQPKLRLFHTSPTSPRPTHLPFVLAFDSAVIAEQLTIIEKDALDEIDWKDFIGLKWRHSPSQIRNWVAYLQSGESDNGIDLVIARFNLVVKWVVSECVLTQQANERARTITKFIHVAQNALQLRNFASMYQITLALLSTDLARLYKTWSLVAPADKATLKRLEELCRPVKNFHALRAEMEAASLDQGCIPFIGLYTHDLVYNAQKPSRIDPAPPGSPPAQKQSEALVNFERYQTAAGIAKGLMRLLEASGRYVFKPQPECLSRCLWLAALEDGEISARGRSLESDRV